LKIRFDTENIEMFDIPVLAFLI